MLLLFLPLRSVSSRYNAFGFSRKDTPSLFEAEFSKDFIPVDGLLENSSLASSPRRRPISSSAPRLKYAIQLPVPIRLAMCFRLVAGLLCP